MKRLTCAASAIFSYGSRGVPAHEMGAIEGHPDAVRWVERAASIVL